MPTISKDDIRRLQDDFDRLKKQFIDAGDELLRIANRAGQSNKSREILDQFWEISNTMQIQSRRLAEEVHPSSLRLGKTAYLIAKIDKETHKVVSIHPYSEPYPTMRNHRVAQATLIQVGGKNYGDACEKIIESMMAGNVFFEWMEPFLEHWYKDRRSRGHG